MMFGSEENELAAGVRALIGEEFDSLALHGFVNSGALRLPGLQQTAREIGCFSLALPEALGGLGLTPTDLVPIYAVLGAYMPPLPLLSTALSADLLETANAGAWLERIATGATVAVALPPWPVGLQLADAADGLRCSGEVPLILDGADADLLVVRARQAHGDAWIICPRDGPGITVEPLVLVDETRSAARVRFEDAPLARDCLIAAGEGSADLADRLVLHAALAIAADSVGGSGAILGKTLDYLRVREQFSRPIGSFQALKHRAANLHLRLVASQSLLEEAAAALLGHSPDALALAMLACAHAGDAYAMIAEDALQLHGGIGFTHEHDAHLHLKRAKLNQALLGGSDRLRDASAWNTPTSLVITD